MEVFEAPEWGRWETIVALETLQWAEAEWSPAAATLSTPDARTTQRSAVSLGLAVRKRKGVATHSFAADGQ